MSDTSKLYDMAALSEASYVLFDNITGLSDKYVLDALKNNGLKGGFSATQAVDFVATWQVITHQGNTGSGFSATLFKNKKTGEYVYATRGTEPGDPYHDIVNADVGDLVIDGLAFKQIVDMYNDWMRISTPQGQTYIAAKLDCLGVETTLLQAERKVTGGLVAGPYEQALKTRGDIVIDGPGGTVYKVVRQNSAEMFGQNDARSKGLGAVPSGAVLSVTGHSLGGHLAVAFSRLFSETGVAAYTINGAGYPTGLLPGLSGNATTNIHNLFAQLSGAIAFDSSKIINFYGSAGPEIVTMNNPLGLVQQGSHQEIFIENWHWDRTFGHGKEQMTDSTAVYNLFFTLDTSLSSSSPKDAINYLAPIFKAGSSKAKETFESLVNAVGKLLVPYYVSAGIGNREDLYSRINQISAQLLTNGLAGKLKIQLSSSALDSIARSDFSAFLSLYNLSPVYMKANGISQDALNATLGVANSDIFSKWQADQALTAEQRAAGEANFSDRYLHDRAAMLGWVIDANKSDTDSFLYAADDGQGWSFYDRSSGKKVVLRTVSDQPQHNVIFGSELDGSIIGGEGTDRLYGGGGNETIVGGKGNDYLEGCDGNDILKGGDGSDIIYGGTGDDKLDGGKGNDTLYGGKGMDTYVYNIGDGNDIIVDSDKKGRIFITRNATEFIAVNRFYSTESSNTWADATGKVQLVHGANWTIVLEDGGTIQLGANFQSGDFGIHLDDAPTTPTPTTTIAGDLTPIDYDLSKDGVQMQLDANGNVKCSAVAMPGRSDYLDDSSGNDRIEGGGGNDFIYQGKGNDRVLGGDGRDGIGVKTGEVSGNDIVEGGAGADIIYGGDGNDQLFGGNYGDMATLVNAGEAAQGINEQGDLIGGAVGNDFIYGADRNDALFGGTGQDVIVAGGGNDFISSGGTFDGTMVYTNTDNGTISYQSGPGFDWTYTTVNDGSSYNPVFTGLTCFDMNVENADGDVVYAGAGNDYVIGAGGSDEIYGGDGNDIVYGEGGDNTIFGGAGDDFLSGVVGLNRSNGGSNYIDGESGNDKIFGGTKADNLFGGDGNDQLQGGDGDDYLDGEAGADTLFGEAGNDQLTGGDGIDELQGGKGDDYLDGEAGDDRLYGDNGNDQMFGGAGDDYLEGNNGDDYLDGEAGNNTLLGGDGNDQLMGGDGDNWIEGDAGNDYIAAGSGNNTILGGDGDDEIYAGDGDNQIQGDAGNDYLSAGSGNDALTGGDGNDMLSGGDGNNTLLGGDGDDEIYGGSGDNWIQGDSGNDYITVESGNNTILGGYGDDQIYGGAGNDRIQGDAGDDYIEAGLGNNLLIGGDGDDTIFGGSGNDQIQGNAGVDYLGGGDGNDALDGGEGNDQLFGGDGDDWLQAGAGDDQLDGGAGNDTLLGGAGNDAIHGGEGDDNLQGDEGSNVLYGGAGNDTYFVDPLKGKDKIYDDFLGDEQNVIKVTTPGVKLEDIVYNWVDGGLDISIRNHGIPGGGATIGGGSTGGSSWGGDTGGGGGGDPRRYPYFPLPDFDFWFDYYGSEFDFEEFLANLKDLNEDAFDRARKVLPPRRIDPLILDLDGDGVETTRLSFATHFDMDGDGFAESTAWVNKDDGLLTLDRNGDGAITNGNELFGDNTILASGRLASNGFEALKDLDSNRDGVINEKDILFDRLRVWQDANGDSKSTSDELHDLYRLGIKEIKLDSQVINAADGKGNTILRNGTFVRTNGTENTIAEYSLNRNTKNTLDNTTVVVSDDIKALPVLYGSGKVADLQQAMAQEQNNRLETLVRQFIGESKSSVRCNLMDRILAEWADVATVNENSRGEFFDGRKLAVIEAFMGSPFYGTSGPNPNNDASVLLDGIYQRTKESNYAQLMMQTHLKDLYGEVAWVQDEVTNAYAVDLTRVADTIKNTLVTNPETGKQLLSEFARTWRASNSTNTLAYLNFRETFVDTDPELGWAFDSGGVPVTNSSSGSNRSEAINISQGKNYGLSGGDGNDIIYGSSTNDCIQNNTGDSILVGGGGNDYLSAGAGDDIIDGGEGNDFLNGGIGDDTYIFRRGAGQDIIYDCDDTVNNSDTVYIGSSLSPDEIIVKRSGNDLTLAITNTADSLKVIGWFVGEKYRVERVLFADGTEWDAESIKQMAILGTEGDDFITGYDTNDIISGLGGHDQISGGKGDDTLEGGVGNDVLNGGQGNDIFDGGAGNDAMSGGDRSDYGKKPDNSNGDDTYLFGRGSGNDTIMDRDTTYGNLDTILLNDDVLPSEVMLGRDGNDLKLIINDSGATLRITGWFTDESSEFQVERIRFADGTEWGVADIRARALLGTPGDDSLIGYSSSDIIQGMDGNDYLDGQAGDDLLDGGAGNDILVGGKGNDTYIFGRGYGVDIIRDVFPTTGYLDAIQLNADVLSSDVTLGVVGENLFLSIDGTSDRLQILNWFSGPDSSVREIHFGDGTIWDTSYIMGVLTTPTDTDDYLIGTTANDAMDGGGGNDSIYGRSGDDILYGSHGDDYLVGEAGDDQLHGGTGSDYLYDDQGNNHLSGGEGADTLKVQGGKNELAGGANNDRLTISAGTNTILFNRGDGFDSVRIYLSSATIVGDTVVFGEGITPENLSIQINDSSVSGYGDGYGGGYGGTVGEPVQLAMGIGNDEGMLIEGAAVSNDYGGGYGGALGLTDLSIRRFVFADGSEMTLGQILSMADDGVIGNQNGSYGDDFLRGSVAHDSIYGYSGDDEIDARDNDDYLYGSYGNDALSAGSGKDKLYGGQGNDVLAGGKGDDYLSGGDGSDVYVFNRGDGKDYLDAAPGSYYGDTDTISMGVDILPGDVGAYIDQDTGNLVLTINGTADSMTIPWFNASDNYSAITWAGVSRIQFIDNNGAARVFDLTGIIDSLKDTLLDSSMAAPVSLFNAVTASFELAGNEAAGGDYAVAYAQTGDLFAVPTYISGGSGNDTLIGRAGNDTLAGGQGDDILKGGAGDDTYSYNIWDGSDTIEDSSSLRDPNTLLFGSGISSDDITLSYDKTSGQLLLGIVPTGDVIKINNFISADPYGPHAIEYFKFYNGEVLTWSQLIDVGFDIAGSPDDDELYGTGTTDRIVANGGDDIIRGGWGDDLLSGGDGKDTYQYELGDGVDTIHDLATPAEGNTILFGKDISASDITQRLTYRDNTLIIRVGSGGDEIHLSNFDPDAADTGSRAIQSFQFADGALLTYEDLVKNTFIIQGDSGQDELKGTNLTDRLYGYENLDILESGAGNDTLTGGTGNDMLAGGQGSDTYVFNLGDGVDSINDTSTLEEGNLILFSEGITQSDLRTHLEGNNLVIEFGTAGDAIHLLNYDYSEDSSTHVVEQIEFADGSRIQLSSLVDPGTDGDDVIKGTPFDDVINAKGGNDALYGLAGNDRLYGGTGNDNLDGGDGEDILVGGQGDDSMAGGAGFDTYRFNLGDGSDTIFDAAEKGVGNIINFGPGITRDSVSFQVNGTTMIIRYGNLGDEIRIENYNPTGTSNGLAISGMEFSDGSVINLIELAKANSVPVAVCDTASLIEDKRIWASGNVLSNDSDPDPGTVLKVTSPGIKQGDYGYLGIMADGKYGYLLADIAPSVQSLGRDTTVADRFNYTVSDGSASAISSLDVAITGTNDSPIVSKHLADRGLTYKKEFSFKLPENSFSDIDKGDVLTYSATLANGHALPDWLKFDAANATFSGKAPNTVSDLDIRVTATDKVSATGNAKGSLSASDTFSLSVVKGNSWVKEKNDQPSQGECHDRNDNQSATLHHPVEKEHRKNEEDHCSASENSPHNDDHEHRSDNEQLPSSSAGYLDSELLERYLQQSDHMTVSRDDQSIAARWKAIDKAISQDLANSDECYRHIKQSVDLSPLGNKLEEMTSSDGYGMGGMALAAGSGTNLKCFSGLKEGLRSL